ncbi:MAG: LolA family protein [Bacillota bacterium]
MKRLSYFIIALVIAAILMGPAGCGVEKKTVTSEKSGDPISQLISRGKKVEGMSYDYVLSSKEGTMAGRVCITAGKIRTETEIEGHKMITIYDGETAYAYDLTQNFAMKVSPGKGKKVDTPQDYAARIDSIPNKVKVLEEANYEGVKCSVVQVSSPDGKEQTKMWISQDYGVPVKVELTGSDGSITIMEYKNLSLGPQPPELFKLPEGVIVTDMNDIIKQIPQKIPAVPGGNQ